MASVGVAVWKAGGTCSRWAKTDAWPYLGKEMPGCFPVLSSSPAFPHGFCCQHRPDPNPAGWQQLGPAREGDAASPTRPGLSAEAPPARGCCSPRSEPAAVPAWRGTAAGRRAGGSPAGRHVGRLATRGEGKGAADAPAAGELQPEQGARVRSPALILPLCVLLSCVVM